MINNAITLVGLAIYFEDENGRRFAEFQPDEVGAEVVPAVMDCHVQLMSSGAMTMVETTKKPRQRSNSLLIRKARHGRLSGTRDHAWQLTLKVFATEGIDWQRAMVEEPIEVMTCLMGPERMREILTEVINGLK